MLHEAVTSAQRPDHDWWRALWSATGRRV